MALMKPKTFYSLWNVFDVIMPRCMYLRGKFQAMIRAILLWHHELSWWMICSSDISETPSVAIDLATHTSRVSTHRFSLQWRHNGRDSASNHQPHDCLLNRLFRPRSKKTSKLRVTGLCVGNSPGTGEFPAQMASNAENVSIWWHHHVSPDARWTH